MRCETRRCEHDCFVQHFVGHAANECVVALPYGRCVMSAQMMGLDRITAHTLVEVLLHLTCVLVEC